MNPENGKKTYESIPIPEKLNEMVTQTIASQNKEEIRMKYKNELKNETKNPHAAPSGKTVPQPQPLFWWQAPLG